MSDVIHPELRRVARVLPRGPVTARRIGTIRALQNALGSVAGAARRVRGRRDDVEIVRDGAVSLRLHRPPAAPEVAPTSGAPMPAMLWIHGGGFVIGNAAQEDAFCRWVARHLGILVASVEYRLAPEHPFPVPLHDCHDGLVLLAGRDDVDATRVVIGGASAGGGLAAGLAALARDRGQVAPVLQLLVYPMLDDRTVLRSGVDETGFRLWSAASNVVGWRSYLGREPGSADVSALAAPARLDDLTGLPPAWMGVGSLDLFHDEDVAYAERLRAAGVPCDLEVVDGAFHGFDGAHRTAAVSRRFRAAQLAAIAGALSIAVR